MTDKIDQALTELKTTLKPFMPVRQAQTLIDNLYHSEEAGAFADLILNLAERIKTIPQVYETDGQGKNALAQLHYFVGSYDGYIVEKDTSDKQMQAFGWASFGYGFEAGLCRRCCAARRFGLGGGFDFLRKLAAVELRLDTFDAAGFDLCGDFFFGELPLTNSSELFNGRRRDGRRGKQKRIDCSGKRHRKNHIKKARVLDSDRPIPTVP